jgi:alkanesulfonate monooxygenase SsuD/methylene tetrahydromethanopterin reductase-like flavin-dependent oxidoreductase (luciferase family)
VDPAEVAIVGTEEEVERQLRHLAEVGVTDFNGVPFSVRDDPDSRTRTRRLLADLAKAWA